MKAPKLLPTEAIKRAKLADILRRLQANPGKANFDEVVEQIATDWFPVFRIDEKGHAQIVIGDGKKR